MIIPADTAWNGGGIIAEPLPVPPRQAVAPYAIDAIARVLRSKEPAMLILSGQALSEADLAAANRTAYASGAKLRTPTQVLRMARGRGRAPVDRIPFVVYRCLMSLARRFGSWIFLLIARHIALGYFLLYPRRVAVSVRFYRRLFPERPRRHALWCTWQ